MNEQDRNRPLYMIGVAAELAGMHPQTLRSYEQKGLVTPQRTRGNTRMYSQADIERLALINELTDEGINLAGVIRILDMRERAEDLITKLGITNFAHRQLSELSGGQQKRALLARALCSTQDLLILDEPTAALDPIVTEELYEMTKKLNAEEGISVIMVSHDVAAATKYANKILHIKHEQLFFGNTEDYVKTELAKAYLGGHGIGH